MTNATLVTALLIALVVGQTAGGQVVMKWQIAKLPPLAEAGIGRFLLACAANPWLWLVAACAFGAMACWALVLSRLPLSYAYPFTSATFILVLILSWWLLGERPSTATIIGTLAIAAGVAVVGIGQRGAP